MAERTTIRLDELIDPFEARVVVTLDAHGHVSGARFDLGGLPRVDALLVGRPVADVPRLVERLCGICPAAHHLAGVRALDTLGGFVVSPAAEAVRRLLHHGSTLDAHAVRLIEVDRSDALVVRRFGKAALAAAGSPGHFPVTAVPGGVAAGVTPEHLASLAVDAVEAIAAAGRLAERLLQVEHPDSADPVEFAGADVALVDEAGRPDLLGRFVRAVASDGTIIADAAPADTWTTLVTETHPGAIAPRPYLTTLGPTAGLYRVGPVAQVRVGVLQTPKAAELQQRWLGSSGSAAAARAIITLHATEVVAELASGDVLRETDLGGGRPDTAPDTQTATGLVDSPRGVLAHTYSIDTQGAVTASRILTPTAQNEHWLATLLAAAAQASGDPLALEASVREADPCLPCSSAPHGAMGLQVRVERASLPDEEA